MPVSLHSPLSIHALSAAVVLALAGCATPGGPGPQAPASPHAGAAGAANVAGGGNPSATTRPVQTAGAAVPGAVHAAAPVAAPPAPGQPPAFATVIREARKIDGLVTMYQKDERVWFELQPKDFDTLFFLSPKLATGIGENRLFGGMMERPQVVQFRRIHNVVQMIAVNTEFTAKAGTPEARGIAAAFSPSLLGAAPVASQPHPQSKAVLVDATSLFVGDMLGLGPILGRTYRQNYAFDGRNSTIVSVRGKPDMVALEVLGHYATAAIAVPTPGAPPGAPVPSVPRTLPDPRSLFLKVHYSLARLPDKPMAGRPADPRVGHFVHAHNDFSDDLARTPKVYHIARWRLEKKDPAAAMSEPVKPITYWIDRTVPVKYRDSITAGILEWNKAFERVGFSNAVVVKVQPDNADFDTLDFGVASVRWMVNASPQFGAIGPRHVDPRTGEILDADISFESLSSRNQRSARARIFPAASAQAWAELLQIGKTPEALAAEGAQASAGGHDPLRCDHAGLAAEQLDFGLEVLAARGELDPDGPEAEQFVQAYLKDVAMHEVGHTLGLRHNFRGSRIYSEAQIGDPEFTQKNAFTGSVMEYAPINLPRPGERRPSPFQTTLGPYDYWVIEYAYKPIAPADEKAELGRIAARSGEPELAYGTDEDMHLGLDPDSLQFDLGNDPIAFARKRFEIEQDLFKRQEARTMDPGQDWSGLRRVLNYALRDAGRAAGALVRQIGGVRTLRDFPNTGRDPLQPVEPARQRAALELLARQVLAADAFVVTPALQRRMAPDFLERTEAIFSGQMTGPIDTPVAQAAHALRQTLLAQLMSDAMASRLLDAESMASRAADALSLTELHDRIESEVWSELSGHGDIPPPRRELQRDHLNRLAALVLRPGAYSRSDARAMVRQRTAALLARIEKAARRPELGAEARRHLADAAESLRTVLAAPMQRAGA